MTHPIITTTPPPAPPRPAPSAARKYWTRGEPLVWLAGAAITLILLLALGLVLIVFANGLGYLWPAPVYRVVLKDGHSLLGERAGHDRDPKTGAARYQFKIGNRDLYGLDFRWIDEAQIVRLERPDAAAVLERQEHGNFYGFLSGLKLTGGVPANAGADELWRRLQEARARLAPRLAQTEALHTAMSRLSTQKEDLRLKLRLAQSGGEPARPRIEQLKARMRHLDETFNELNTRAGAETASLRAEEAIFKDAGGQEKVIALADIVRADRPNQMSFFEKIRHYGAKVWELLSTGPREANTEGGLLPAIFGTVLLVMMMSLFVVPLGVIAAVYLREYAREGLVVRLVRIAVNNLAGVPSIVYGVFGLGFFVYGLGSSIDRLFFSARLPAPTFGTGGLLWASLTLALLTVPVVIVATEEALAAVPRGIREGSLALGATKFQTLTRILLPMASPGILTGLILAMARAAGEVAPLMIVGVVKLAPAMPLDTQFPYLHLERKFMHLGFHIFDVGFQSPNVEAAKPMVFVTTLLLLAIVIVMSAAAIILRNRMRRRYTSGAF